MNVVASDLCAILELDDVKAFDAFAVAHPALIRTLLLKYSSAFSENSKVYSYCLSHWIRLSGQKSVRFIGKSTDEHIRTLFHCVSASCDKEEKSGGGKEKKTTDNDDKQLWCHPPKRLSEITTEQQADDKGQETQTKEKDTLQVEHTCTRFRNVEVHRSSTLTNASFSCLLHCRDTLQRLDLIECAKINNDTFSIVASCDNLTVLRMDARYMFPYYLTTVAKNLSPKANFEDGIILMCNRLRKLRHLSLSERYVSENAASAISSLPELACFEAAHSGIDCYACTQLSKSKSIKHLMISHNSVGPAGAAALGMHSTLEDLHIGQNHIGDGGAIALCSNPNFRKLILHRNELSVECIPFLNKLDQLTELDVGNNHLIGDEGATLLSINTHLTSLTIDDCELTAKGSEAIGRNCNCATLHIASNQNLKNDGVIMIAQNTHITELDVSLTSCGDDGVVALCGMPLLKTLNIYVNALDMKAAVALAANKTLTYVPTSSNDKIGDIGANAIALNSFLSHLDLSYCHVNDAGLIGLSHSSSSVDLHLSGNNITETGLKMLIERDHTNSLSSYDLNYIKCNKSTLFLELARNPNVLWVHGTGNKLDHATVSHLTILSAVHSLSRNYWKAIGLVIAIFRSVLLNH
eukprot:TRINITY_DN8853_c0_g1_i1.p1 TRINITY_DN8853_c0_g1~~TRINITY_DN8853_c0_g1_i1.p1  ORF type:complete len:636 (+),score=92.09 TRINITY_DN8853_c0_g1_i1:3-1910(+)